ncbi:MAG TPA: hypothetical protein VGQ11_10555, partial [Candidatus Acidoferrales bacterium]|nr:hypothetical protein [Candidatus Acidoferrales bacterium]
RRTGLLLKLNPSSGKWREENPLTRFARCCTGGDCEGIFTLDILNCPILSQQAGNDDGKVIVVADQDCILLDCNGGLPQIIFGNGPSDSPKLQTQIAIQFERFPVGEKNC